MPFYWPTVNKNQAFVPGLIIYASLVVEQLLAVDPSPSGVTYPYLLLAGIGFISVKVYVFTFAGLEMSLRTKKSFTLVAHIFLAISQLVLLFFAIEEMEGDTLITPQLGFISFASIAFFFQALVSGQRVFFPIIITSTIFYTVSYFLLLPAYTPFRDSNQLINIRSFIGYFIILTELILIYLSSKLFLDKRRK